MVHNSSSSLSSPPAAPARVQLLQKTLWQRSLQHKGVQHCQHTPSLPGALCGLQDCHPLWQNRLLRVLLLLLQQ
jgi:hypothetical protein